MTSDDNAVYFCEEVHIEVEIITLPPAVGRAEDFDRELHIKWVVFVPNNGRQHGKLFKVPFERLVAIAEDQD
jgi:hypothetical protein